MSVSLFLAIVALILIATVAEALVIVVLTALYMRNMPKMIEKMTNAVGEEDVDLDEHFKQTPEPKFLMPN